MDKNWSLAREDIDNFLKINEEYMKFEIGNYFKYEIGTDIKHILFTLSRYKFVSKLAAYKSGLRILELGCNEAWGSILLKQNTDLKEYTGVDFDEEAIEWNKRHLPKDYKFIMENILDLGEINKEHFNLILSLDVIEHIEKSKEEAFFEIVQTNLSDDGFAVIGTPSEYMTPYATEGSRIAHINMYDQARLYDLASRYFHNVFIFNMNDEVVNTSFAPMSCYIFAVCCSKK